MALGASRGIHYTVALEISVFEKRFTAFMDFWSSIFISQFTSFTAGALSART